MSEQKKIKEILENLVDKKGAKKEHPTVFEGVKTLHVKKERNNNKNSTAKKEKNNNKKSAVKKEKTQNQKKKEVVNQTPLERSHTEQTKNTGMKVNKTQTNQWSEDVLKVVQARKIQMMSKPGADYNTSPLQMHLVRSESLRIAQEKIVDLEENIHKLREKNESLVSAGAVLKENNNLLKSKLEELKYVIEENKTDFKDEKDILISALEEAKTQMTQLKNKNEELEKRLSRDIHGIRARENALESRIEILKMESSVLQREKDKKIIELKKQAQKTKESLDRAYKKNQTLEKENNKLQESSRRTVSVLRATIYNLEGVNSNSNKTTKTG